MGSLLSTLKRRSFAAPKKAYVLSFPLRAVGSDAVPPSSLLGLLKQNATDQGDLKTEMYFLTNLSADACIPFTHHSSVVLSAAMILWSLPGGKVPSSCLQLVIGILL